MAEAKIGDRVKVHYTAKAENMVIFDSKQQVNPLEFKIGDGQIIPAFEIALIGMEAGDQKTINIQSDEAFGPYLNELITKVDKSQLPANLDLEIGQQLQIQQPDGQVLLVKVLDITEKDITFDANHPLAGKNITFNIDLVAIL
jgi:peptidylprolyl isomerase